MQHINLDFQFSDGKSYYTTCIDLTNGEVYIFKNAGCIAAIYAHFRQLFALSPATAQARFKCFSTGTQETNMERIPKKYHKHLKQ
jgi:hypothetical protein